MSTEIIYNTYDNEASIVHDDIVNDKVLKVVTAPFGNSDTKDVLEYPLAENLLEVQSYGFSQFIKTSFLVRKAEVILHIDDEDIVVAEAENIEMNHWHRLEGFFTMNELKKVDFNNATLRLRITKAFNDPEVYIYRPCLTKGDTIPDWFPSLEEIMGDIVESQSSLFVDKRLEELASDLTTQEKDDIKAKLDITSGGGGADLSNYYDKQEVDGLLDDKEDVFTKNTAFNKNFGVGTNDVSRGDHTHSELHTHSNKSTLDGITPTKISEWDGKAEENHTHSELHEHTNKAVLDVITEEDLAKYLEANEKIVTGISFTGDVNKTLTITRLDGTILTASFIDKEGDGGGVTDGVLNTLEFNTTTGVLTATVLNGTTEVPIDVNLDGRYSLITHTHQLSDINGLVGALDLKEDVSNKKTDIEANKASDTFYPSVKAVYDWAVAKFLGLRLENLASDLTEIEKDEIKGKLDITETDLSNYYDQQDVDGLLVDKEDAFAKNTAFNKNFGVGTNDVARGDHTHSELHTHTNKGTLDGITPTKISEWDSKAEGNHTHPELHTHSNKSTLDDITPTKISEWDSKAEGNHTHSELHTHSNKTILDNISQSKIDEWDGKAEENHTHSELHTHSNKSTLDTITAADLDKYLEAHEKTVTGVSFTGDVNKTLTVTRQDGTTLTASFVDKEGDGGGVTDGVLNTLEFNATTGVLTATVLNDTIEVPIDVNLDGRYSLITHTHQLSDINGLQDALDSKVDKVAGKELSDNNFSTQEKNKLASLENFDDSAIQSELDTKVDKVVGKELSSNDFTDNLRDKLAGLENFDDSAIQSELDTKVDKVVGKGLSDENYTLAEKDKLAGLENFDDSAIQSELDTKVDKVVGKGLSDENYTLAEKDKLAGLENFDDSSIQSELDTKADTTYVNTQLDTKVDKVVGKGLSDENYTLAEKNKLASLENFDDSTIQAELDTKVDKVVGKGLSDENYTLAEKDKLGGIEVGATANSTDAQLRDRATHTGVQPIASVDGLQDALDEKVDDTDSRLTNSREWTASVVTQPEAEAGTSTTARKWTSQRVRQAILGWWNTSIFKTKLDGIEVGATANATDAQLRDRATHTGAQPISSVTNLQSSLDSKVDKQAGMGLSSNDFTTAEKQKLAGLEEPNYRGTFATETSIQELTDPKPGNYALLDLGVGEDVVPYFYDVTDGKWVPGGGSTELTPAQLKSLYESNPDTNAFTDTEKTKLSGIATQATKNQTDTYLRNRANHTGSQAMSTITGLSGALDSKVDKVAGKELSDNNYTNAEKTKLAGLENFDDSAIQSELDTKVDKVAGKELSDNNYTNAEKTKLAGIAPEATKNDTDAYLLDRANHTGSQEISTITGLSGALDSKVGLTKNETIQGKKTFATVPATAQDATAPDDLIRKSQWDAYNTAATSTITSNFLTKENLSNKKTAIETNKASNTFYPSIKAVYDWAVAKFLGLRLENLASDLTEIEQGDIKTKLDITETDLSNYFNKQDVNLLLNEKVSKSGDEGITGKKTFAVVPGSGEDAAVGNDLIRKSQWDAYNTQAESTITSNFLTKENLSSKKTSIETNKTSNTFYPSIKAVYDWVVGNFLDLRLKNLAEDLTTEEKDIVKAKLDIGGGGASAYTDLTDAETADLPKKNIPLTLALADKEDAFTKNTAFNKNFGTGSKEVATGDHTHGQYLLAKTFEDRKEFIGTYENPITTQTITFASWEKGTEVIITHQGPSMPTIAHEDNAWTLNFIDLGIDFEPNQKSRVYLHIVERDFGTNKMYIDITIKPITLV